MGVGDVNEAVKAVNGGFKEWVVGYKKDPRGWKHTSKKVVVTAVREVFKPGGGTMLAKGLLVGVLLKTATILSKAEPAFCAAVYEEALPILKQHVFTNQDTNAMLLKASIQLAKKSAEHCPEIFIRCLCTDPTMFVTKWEADDGQNVLQSTLFDGVNPQDILSDATPEEVVYIASTLCVLNEGELKERIPCVINEIFRRYPARSVLNKIFLEEKEVEAAMYEVCLDKSGVLVPKYDMFYDYTKANMPPAPLSKKEKQTLRAKRRRERDEGMQRDREEKARREVEERARVRKEEEEAQRKGEAERREREVFLLECDDGRRDVADEWYKGWIEITRDPELVYINRRARELAESAATYKARVSSLKKAERTARLDIATHQTTAYTSITSLHQRNVASLTRLAQRLVAIHPTESSDRQAITRSEQAATLCLFSSHEAAHRKHLASTERDSRQQLYQKMLNTYWWIPLRALLKHLPKS
eukprot:TRINITY_DN34320_c0_g1_i1.p1 TRINITY_DN34320_c0_g1~~TRINITY_DN34320_c0_g1_i1.p1  ORF type:complete len:539 (+),score=91.49 TRINITY_DN34320_c0_g1_i1:199-1617(+)